MPHHYVNDDLCKAQSIDSNFNWLVMNHLCKPVDNDKD